jgi:phospho-N-acetylmuramoyl-pentapeptide-transferase
VNAKTFSSKKPLNPSGSDLLTLLLIILILGAIALDWSHSWELPKFSLSLVGCTLATAATGAIAVPLLRKLKTGQIVQEDGPQTHLKKAGTPTMGGIFFVPLAAIAALSQSFSSDTIAVVAVTLGYGLIGWIDDWQILRQKSNKGISPRMKLTLQIAIAIVFSLWLFWQRGVAVTTIDLPGGWNLALGWLFLPLAVFVFAAESNATNLTDGVDGLAAGTGAIAFLGLSAIIATDSPDLAIFCACLSGGCLGFLVHNRNPATVFMGDTGSLALGGALAAVGLLSNNLWGLFLVSGIFFVESLSVIAQVLYYKATKDDSGKGKRLFKMAPIHHHFELSGWSETQVVGIFYLINILLALVAYLN